MAHSLGIDAHRHRFVGDGVLPGVQFLKRHSVGTFVGHLSQGVVDILGLSDGADQLHAELRREGIVEGSLKTVVLAFHAAHGEIREA